MEAIEKNNLILTTAAVNEVETDLHVVGHENSQYAHVEAGVVVDDGALYAAEDIAHAYGTTVNLTGSLTSQNRARNRIQVQLDAERQYLAEQRAQRNAKKVVAAVGKLEGVEKKDEEADVQILLASAVPTVRCASYC
jgi:hypothetical protein